MVVASMSDDARGELLACPLCQSNDLQVGSCYQEGSSERQAAVRCAKCGCRSTLLAWNTRAAPSRLDAEGAGLPKPETMLTYASILEKPQYWIDPKTSQKYLLATGEIIEAACAALRYCAALSTDPGTVAVTSTMLETPHG